MRTLFDMLHINRNEKRKAAVLNKMRTLPQRLTFLMEAVDSTPGKLSRDLGKERSYISQILKEKIKTPRPEFFEYLQSRYNVNPIWMKTGEGEPFLEGGRQNNIPAASLVNLINHLSPDRRSAAIVVLRALAKADEAEAEKGKKR